MWKKFQLIWMILCLGIFVFPKTVIDINISKTSCCQIEKKDSGCCKKETRPKDGHSDQQKKDHCKDDCSNCKACAFCYAIYAMPSQHKPLEILFEGKDNHQFSYKRQSLFSTSFNIWQPPKIG